MATTAIDMPVDEVLEALRENRYEGNRDLRGVQWAGKDLSGLNLSGFDLREANLHGARLVKTELLNANLRNADLTEADAHHAGFGNADLTGATLFNATLDQATFTSGTLTGSDFRAASLVGARLRNTDLSDTHFCRADLTGADLSGSRIHGAEFDECCLSDARIQNVRGFQQATWIGCNIAGTDFCGAYAVRRTIMDENYLHEFRTHSKLNAFIYKVWSITSDCGRSFLRWGLFTLLLASVFAGLFSFVEVDYGDYPTKLSPFYYSVVTLTTLGYGDSLPASVPAQILAMVEVCLGYVMLGGLLSIFSNKMARRAD